MLTHDEKPGQAESAETPKQVQETWASRELMQIVQAVGMDPEQIALKIAIFPPHQQKLLLEELHHAGGRSFMHDVQRHLDVIQGGHHHHHKQQPAAEIGDGLMAPGAGGAGVANTELMAPTFDQAPAVANSELMAPTFADRPTVSNSELLAPGSVTPAPTKRKGGDDELLDPSFTEEPRQRQER
jgi:hypothetical protein